MIVNKNNYSIDVFHNASLIHHPSASDDRRLQRYDHMMMATECVEIDGSIAEFGVFKGASLNWICTKFPNDIVYAFDSYEGLPEDWEVSGSRTYKKGHFFADLNLLKKEHQDLNISWEKGWFEDSIPKWIERVQPTQMKLIHLDADLYSSTKTVMELLTPYIVPGTVIVFDEMYPWGEKPHEYWDQHEYKVLKEWIEDYNREFEVLYRTAYNQQASIRIIK